jgi:hypothetical protein
MKPKHCLAFAAALAGCAVAYGIQLLGGKQTERPQRSAKSPAMKERRALGFQPAADPAGPQRVRPASRQQPDRSVAAQAGISAPPVPRRNIEGAPDRNAPLMPESQWRANAARVEMEANHELNRLATLLDLDPVQQEKVFASVARQSPYWLPGMLPGGVGRSNDGASGQPLTRDSNNDKRPAPGNNSITPANPAVITPGAAPVIADRSSGPNEPADIAAFLNPDQAMVLINDEMERQAWWEEMLPQLLPPDFGVVAAAAPDIKEFDGGEEVLEE